MNAAPEDPDLAQIYRAEWGKVVSFLVRLLGDLDRAEECAQEAWLSALESWPLAGIPERPGAWLMTTARNRALDWLRANTRGRNRRHMVEIHESLRQEEADADIDVPDESSLEVDRLRLIFTCFHPALPRENQIALTLRLLGGLTTSEIAKAFLISDSTAGQRIVRAKRAIRDRRLPYRIPEAVELPERLSAVLDVLYLIFNAGYAASEGAELIRSTLCDDALRLSQMIMSAFPGESEATGLFVLCELQAARQSTRIDPHGDLVLLEKQDRGRWDRVRIERARQRLEAAISNDLDRGPFVIQAQIAACHASVSDYARTDWTRIVRLYEDLSERVASPIVRLNHAVAVGEASGPARGLDLFDRFGADERLTHYALLEATRADFLRRLERFPEAIEAYTNAIEETDNDPQRRFLEARRRACEHSLP